MIVSLCVFGFYVYETEQNSSRDNYFCDPVMCYPSSSKIKSHFYKIVNLFVLYRLCVLQNYFSPFCPNFTIYFHACSKASRNKTKSQKLHVLHSNLNGVCISALPITSIRPDCAIIRPSLFWNISVRLREFYAVWKQVCNNVFK